MNSDLSSPPPNQTEFNSSPPQMAEELFHQNNRHIVLSPGNDYRSRRMAQVMEGSDYDRTKSLTPRTSFSNRPQSAKRDLSPDNTRNYSLTESSARIGLTNRTLARGLTASPQIDDKQIDRDFAATVAGANKKGPRSADSESTASTTAASSVWDELDDLKSRIRRLEVTGRMPASGAGGASNSSGERPRTATTTVTTVSSSPRNPPGISPVNSTFGTTSHPLLHTALAKSKLVMPADVYRHLELAAKDALDLANTVGAPGSAAPTQVGVDRTVRRKADSVCRSLTELCLALSENRHNIAPPLQHPFIQSQFTSRPVSRIGEGSVAGRESVMSGRERLSYPGRESVMSDRLASRTVARFAERKNSLASINVAAGYSPRGDPRSDPVPSPTTVRHRTSMVLKDGFLEERERERERDRYRAPSRAATEAGMPQHLLPQAHRHHPSSRGYTTHDVTSTLAPRRGLAAQSSPLAPSPSKRFFAASMEARSQEFNMTGGPINERLVQAAQADPDRFRDPNPGRTSTQPTRRIMRGLRDTLESDGRSSAMRRVEAATERLLRR